MEALIDPRQGQEADRDDLEREDEDVESRLALVPSGVGHGPRRHPRRAGLEPGDRDTQQRGQAHDGGLGGVAAVPEGLLVVVARQQRGEAQHQQRGGRDDQEERRRGQLQVAADLAHVGVARVRLQHHRDDDHDEGPDDAGVGGPEGDPQGAVPAERGLLRAQDALREQEVDDVEEQHAGVDEDVGGEGEAYVGLPVGPDDAQDESSYPRRAEPEQDPRYGELVAPPPVHLQDRHVRRCTADEQTYEDGRDGHVGYDGGDAAAAGDGGGVGWPRGL